MCINPKWIATVDARDAEIARLRGLLREAKRSFGNIAALALKNGMIWKDATRAEAKIESALGGEGGQAS